MKLGSGAMPKPLKENPSAKTLYMRAWRASHPENRDYQRQYQSGYLADEAKAEVARSRAREWAKNNRERAKERSRQHYYADPGHHHATGKVWDEQNRERHLEIQKGAQAKRRALIKGNRAERVDLQAVIGRCGNICGICGGPINGYFEFDHILPIAKGGEHSESNLQQAHLTCNRRKSVKLDFQPAGAAACSGS